MAEPFDTHALIAKLRQGDEEAFSEAYRITFGNELGRMVLAHVAASAGVGQRYAGATDLYSVGFHQGGHDLALDILDRAGFDQASAVLAVMTDQLEGPDYERSAQPEPDGYAEPDPDLGD